MKLNHEDTKTRRHKEQVGDSPLEPELEDLASRVIGAAIEVHRHVGPGFPEQVYQNAMSIELNLRAISHQTERPVIVFYKDERVGDGRIDILVEERLVVELKVVKELAEVHRAQVSAYLKATKLRLGLLFNFNTAVLKDGIKRIIH